MTNSRGSKTRALSLCALAYLVAGGAALGLGYAMGERHPVLIAALGDLTATFVVFLFGMGLNNSSIYDPYWSVAPIPIALYWFLTAPIGAEFPARATLATGLLCLWGLRLTWNWIRRWHGLGHEDWRYVNIRRASGKFYWPASFLGIHLFPTVMVFLGCLPLFPALVAATRGLNWLDGAATAVTVTAVLIEAIADRQLWRFLKGKRAPGEILSSGLWATSRYPNYFGEVLFWWGMFLFGLAADPSWWWTVVGPLAMTALFWFVSIPMMEKRNLERRPGYQGRIHTTSRLVPWFPRSGQN